MTRTMLASLLPQRRINAPRSVSTRHEHPVSAALELVGHCSDLDVAAVTLQQVHHRLQVRRGTSVALQQREDTRLGRDPAHLLDGGDVKIYGESVGVGEQEGRAESDVELTLTKAEVGE
jgi:hypothetical protein